MTESIHALQIMRRILISALIVGAGFFVSKVTGILDDLILARTIGPGPELDAYYAAFGLPDLLFTLIAGGALASAFIPIFTGFLTREDRSGAWQLFSAVVNTAFIAAAIGSTILALVRPMDRLRNSRAWVYAGVSTAVRQSHARDLDRHGGVFDQRRGDERAASQSAFLPARPRAHHVQPGHFVRRGFSCADAGRVGTGHRRGDRIGAASADSSAGPDQIQSQVDGAAGLARCARAARGEVDDPAHPRAWARCSWRASSRSA